MAVTESNGSVEDSDGSHWSILSQALAPIGEGRLASGTVQRRKTALSTTYRLYVDCLDGSRDISATRVDTAAATGGSSNTSEERSPLLYAKKAKSAIASSQFVVYLGRNGRAGGDTKEVAIGRLCRGSGGVYWGRLYPRLPGLTVEGARLSFGSGSNGSGGDKVGGDGSVSSAGGGSDDCRRGAVCVNVMSGGLDRLIHVSAVAALDPWPGMEGGGVGAAPVGRGKERSRQAVAPTDGVGGVEAAGDLCAGLGSAGSSGGAGGAVVSDGLRRGRSGSGGDGVDEEMASVLMVSGRW